MNAGEEPPTPIEYVEVGEEVVVTEGPFVGMRGVLIEERGRARVAVRLTVIRRAVSVELPRRLLRTASP